MLNETPIQPNRAGRVNIVTVLIVFISLGFVLFAILTVYAFHKASIATNTLYMQKTAAAKAAAKAQAASDKEANLKANESPYRTYTAPDSFGKFVISFPKDWSSYVQESESDQQQVNLALNPDSVSTTDDDDDPVAARVILQQKSLDDSLNALTSYIKKGQLTEADITVSGIKGTDVTGTFPDGTTLRAVYIPVRDKTIIISNERSNYANEYVQILADAKINP